MTIDMAGLDVIGHSIITAMMVWCVGYVAGKLIETARRKG